MRDPSRVSLEAALKPCSRSENAQPRESIALYVGGLKGGLPKYRHGRGVDHLAHMHAGDVSNVAEPNQEGQLEAPGIRHNVTTFPCSRGHRL